MMTEQEVKAHYTVICPAKRTEKSGAILYNKRIDLEECKKCPWLKSWSVGKLTVKCEGRGAEL